MAANDYVFVDHWRVKGTVQEISDVLRDGPSFARWWPSVYRESRLVAPGDEQGRGAVLELVSHARLPYAIHWRASTLSVNHPHGFAIRATGDFDGTGEWTFRQDGEWVDMVYEWRIRTDRPLLKYGSMFMKPLLANNHHWSMRMGERSLDLELQRRRARTSEERDAVPPPPGPVSAPPRTAWTLPLGLAGALLWLVRGQAAGKGIPSARSLLLWTGGGIAAAGFVTALWRKSRNSAEQGLPPTLSGRPFLGVLPDLRRDPLELMTRAGRDHSSVVTLPIGPARAYLVNHPEGARHVLDENSRNYVKSKGFNNLAPTLRRIMGEGLNVSDGKFWQRERRLVEQALRTARMEDFAGTVVEQTSAMLNRWHLAAKPGKSLDVEAEMMRLTLDILIRIMFGPSIGADAQTLADSIANAMQYLNDRLMSPMNLPPGIPTRANRRYQENIRTIDSIVYRLIRDRRQQGSGSGDLLSALIQARDPQTGEGLDDQQLRDEIITLFTAGYPPESLVLTWVWYFLARNPEVEQKLRGELETVLGGRMPVPEDAPRLSYARMVMQEAARLCPPNWGIFRTSIQPDNIDGYSIPAGIEVIVNVYYINRHPDFWNEPQAFRPERFSPDQISARPGGAYLSFNMGPRGCLGREFALIEGALIIAAIAQRFRLTLLPGQDVDPQASSTFLIRPPHGLPVRLEEVVPHRVVG